MIPNEKVVPMFDQKVYEELQRFFKKLERRSKLTKESYEADIRQYFRIMQDKELEWLKIEDVQLTLDNFEDFLEKLMKMKNRKKERTFSNATINRKITAIKEMLKYLFSKKIVTDISFLNIVETLKQESNHYDPLKTEEIYELYKIAKQEKEKATEKYLLLKFAFTTGLRKAEILNTKWEDFIPTSENVEIRGFGKGSKKYSKYISKIFYAELLSLKSDSRYVFSIPTTTLDKMFIRLLNKSNFKDDGRFLVFHSIRKASACRIYKLTKDINLTREFLNHSNVATTIIYLGLDQVTLKEIATLDEIETDLYKNIPLEVLRDIVEDMGLDFKLALNKKIREHQTNTNIMS